MGDPLKPIEQTNNNLANEVVSTNPSINAESLEPFEPLPPLIDTQTNQSLPVLPSTNQTPTLIPETNIEEKHEPSVLTSSPEAPEVVKVEPPIITAPSIEAQKPLLTEENKKPFSRKHLLLILFITSLLVGIGLIIYWFITSGGLQQRDSSSKLQDSAVVSSPNGSKGFKTFEGRLYNIKFLYDSKLGAVQSTTISAKNEGSSENCNIENISFSKSVDLKMSISTGNCPGTLPAPSEYTKVSSKDGKSFFITTKKLDQKLFPGKTTISVVGGVDKSDTYPTGMTGLRIDAIRISDADQFDTYIRDMLESMEIDLTSLKSNDFDS